MKTYLHLLTTLSIVTLLFVLASCCCEHRSDFTESKTFANCPELNAQYIEDEIILKFEKDVSDSLINIVLDRIRPKSDTIYKCMCSEKLYLIKYENDPNIDLEERLKTSDSDSDVEGNKIAKAYYNTSISLDVFPDNTYYQNPYKKRTTDYSKNNEIVIAVIDAGVDNSNQTIAEHLWVNDGELPLYDNGKDDDDNCLPDDINGYDFTQRHSSFSSEINLHGTIISKILLHSVPDDIDIYIMDLRIFDKDGNSSLYDAMCAFAYAKENGADIINASWGYYSQNIDTALLNQIRAVSNIPVVSSAGNHGVSTDVCAHYPSGFNSSIYEFQNVIGVAALNDCQDDLAKYSNYGTRSIGIAANGNFDLSSMGYEDIEGTSFAAAQTSRHLAIMKKENPGLNSAELRECLFDNAVKLNLKVISHGKIKTDDTSCP